MHSLPASRLTIPPEEAGVVLADPYAGSTRTVPVRCTGMRLQLTFLMASQLWSETRGSKAPSGICTDTMSYLEPLKLDCQLFAAFGSNFHIQGGCTVQQSKNPHREFLAQAFYNAGSSGCDRADSTV
ncbi:hypothetical protein BDQ94DRAFT_155187, partial [Aspergillus welwitschiae]